MQSPKKKEVGSQQKQKKYGEIPYIYGKTWFLRSGPYFYRF